MNYLLSHVSGVGTTRGGGDIILTNNVQCERDSSLNVLIQDTQHLR
jgi:hypothetical protein